ncbi:MAG: sulfatase [Wenzhouxiangellaceae bacterium]|nr:sulfatase [Wenzhouxiangellaceae bacterium]
MMKPLFFRSAIVLATSAICVAACSNESTAPTARSAPVSNLVLICVDTVRWDTWWIPEQIGQDDAFSPWAQRSQVMSQAISAAPWTVPSVASVLTGLYPSQHGGGLFSQETANLADEVPSAINPSVPLLAQMLSEADIQTLAVSAHPWFGADYGFQRGFETLNLRKGAERIRERGMQLLDQVDTDQQRFFLYLHYMDVHDPHLDLHGARQTAAAMPPEFRKQLMAAGPVPACDDPDSDMCVRFLAYADSVLKLRRQIAALLDELDSRGVLEDTLVVLYSDHGEEFHDHLQAGLERKEDPRDIYGFGHGQSLYQEQLHVPLQLWHPALSARAVPDFVSLVDVLPSVFDWMGLALPAGVEFPGRSFARSVEDQAPGPFEWQGQPAMQKDEHGRDLFASGIAYGPEQMAVINGGSKLIWRQVDNSREYYDLRADPLETRSVAPASDQRADALDASLDRYFDWFGSQEYLPPELSDDSIEKLKGVGYLQGIESKGSDARPGDGYGE